MDGAAPLALCRLDTIPVLVHVRIWSLAGVVGLLQLQRLATALRLGAL